MRRIFEILRTTGLYTGMLCAHGVVYQSAAGTTGDASETPFLKPPFPRTLTFGSADGSITVMHYPGEPCVVSAAISIPASDDPLVQILANGGMTVPATGLDVKFIVHILRNAHDPAESVTLSGTWKAIGDLDTGGSDPKNCNGLGAILASLAVQRGNVP